MAYIRLPLGIKVAVEYDWNGEPVVNIYHVVTPDPITSIKLTTIANVFITWFVGNLASRMSNEIALTGVTALNLDVANGEKIFAPQIPPFAGTIVGESVSNNVASVCSLYTAQTGRSFRGRSYIAGMAELYVAQNELDAAVAAGIVADFVVLDGALVAANCTLVVASFQSGGVPRAVGIATSTDSYAVNLRVDTQRRRLPRA